MTIDTTKITPEKLAEMNDSLITDNNHLRQRLAELEAQIVEQHQDSLSLIDQIRTLINK